MYRSTLAVLLAAALAGPALAGPALAQGTPKPGGTLTLAINSDVRSLEPGINRDSNTDAIVYTIYEGLVGYRTDLSVGPALAESWSVSDDGRTYTFTLREGVTFHNGAPLTSAEVKWSWDRQFAASGWLCKRSFDGAAGLKVVAVEAPDPRTVIYRLEAPSGLFLKMLANYQCGIVVSHPDSVDGEGKWKAAIGTGPYKLREWKRGEYLALEKFAAYSQSLAPGSAYAGARQAHADEVMVRVIPDRNAAEAALLTGGVDIIPDLEPGSIQAMRQRGQTVMTSPGLAWSALLIQTKDPLLSNPKIRQAIAHAIDLDQIAAVRTAGITGPSPSLVSPSSAYYDERFKAWPAYDPKKSAALLKEAGYARQPLKIQTNKRYMGMYECAVLIQSMLAAAGFQVDIEVLDWATQLDNYLNGKFQLQSFGYSGRLDPGLGYAAVIADKAKNAWAQWDDPEAIRLLSESAATLDEARRKEIFLQLHKMMQEQVPIVGLYFDPVIEAVGAKVRGYKSWAGNKPILWGVWKE